MSTSPISILNSDTLLMIFNTIPCQLPNTDTLIKRPLNVVRTASQVCQEWRGLLLASPLIWGRVIDLDVADALGPQGIKWMDEVVNRAGSAPLWISGIVSRPTEGSDRLFDTQAYFIRLLEAWERIEQLSVVIHGRKIPDDIQSHFLSPAPILKLFNVDIRQSAELPFVHIPQPRSSEPLFADYAPSLRIMKADKVAFKSNSPWLSNIREIAIPQMFTLQEVFTLLQHTPLIQTVSIGGTEPRVWEEPLPPLPKLTLPNLSSIRVLATLAIGARILDHIFPHKTCAPHMNLVNCAPGLQDRSILSSFKKNLPFYISGYFTANTSTSLLVEMTNNAFGVTDIKPSSGVLDTFRIYIISIDSNQREADDLIECLLDTFRQSSIQGGNSSTSLFESVTLIKLGLGNVQRTVIPALYAMLQVGVFPHVQAIEISEGSCQALFDISCLDGTGENHQSVVFPELRIVCMASPMMTVANRYPIETGPLTSFIINRKRIGFPVSTLILACRIRAYHPIDLRALEAVDGLKVIWIEPITRDSGIVEEYHQVVYIRGTGEPDKLKGLF